MTDLDYLKYATEFTIYEKWSDPPIRLIHKNYEGWLRQLLIVKCNPVDMPDSYKVTLNGRLCLSKKGFFVQDRRDFDEKEILKYRFETLQAAFKAVKKIIAKINKQKT